MPEPLHANRLVDPGVPERFRPHPAERLAPNGSARLSAEDEPDLARVIALEGLRADQIREFGQAPPLRNRPGSAFLGRDGPITRRTCLTPPEPARGNGRPFVTCMGPIGLRRVRVRERCEASGMMEAPREQKIAPTTLPTYQACALSGRWSTFGSVSSEAPHRRTYRLRTPSGRSVIGSLRSGSCAGPSASRQSEATPPPKVHIHPRLFRVLLETPRTPACEELARGEAVSAVNARVGVVTAVH